jgi:hypothetical protein
MIIDKHRHLLKLGIKPILIVREESFELNKFLPKGVTFIFTREKSQSKNNIMLIYILTNNKEGIQRNKFQNEMQLSLLVTKNY